MKESSNYLSFFSKYFVYYLLSIIIGLSGGWFVFSRQPVKYKQIQLFELAQLSEPIPQMEKLADEVVTQVRSENVKQEMGVQSDLIVYKPGPFSITVELVSNSTDLKESELVQNYVLSNFQVVKKGETVVHSDKQKLNYFLFFGALISVVIVFLFSLIKEYFDRF